MSNDMLEASDMSHLPGAPFTQDEIDAAVAVVRSACGWHIAPVRDETAVLDVQCGEPRLRLPTRYLVSVDEIRDAEAETVFDEARYRVSKPLNQVIRRGAYWPAGYARVEVDFTHGYDVPPADLLVLLAEAARTNRRDQSVKTLESLDFSESFGIGGAALSDSPLGTGGILARYSLYQPAGMA